MAINLSSKVIRSLREDDSITIGDFRKRIGYNGGATMGCYKYKKCARCGKYNGTSMKLCASCRKYMSKMNKKKK